MAQTADQFQALEAVRTDAACPACGSQGMQPFHTVRGVPLHSCLQMPDRASALAHPKGDLELAFCESCGFVTNLAFEPERLNYCGTYEETQGASPTFSSFARALAGEWIHRYDLRGKRIVEIGCGKGEFLALICAMGDNYGIGFDPAYVAGRHGGNVPASHVTFRAEFYSDQHRDVEADFYCCRHTLEHIAPVADFLKMLRGNLEGVDKVVVGFEVPDLQRILEQTAFWDLYYEHCSYFTLGTLGRLFRRCGFEVLQLRRVYGDQYLVVDARPAPCPVHQDDAEDQKRLRAAVAKFARESGERIARWRAEFEAWGRAGKRVALWGSGSKAVGFLTTLGLGEQVEAVVDINPHKHGKYMPGCWAPVVAPGELRELRPDVVIAMNSIYRAEIARDLERMGVDARLVALQ